MEDDTFLYIITFFVFGGAVALILIEYVFKKWKCKEGKCEKVFGGDYSTLKECLASKECVKTNSEPESEPINEYRPSAGYNCVNGTCVVSDENHIFANINDCNDNCGGPTVIAPTYSYGYPYSYPYGVDYGYGRRWWPRRRSPRRRWSPIRRPGQRPGPGPGPGPVPRPVPRPGPGPGPRPGPTPTSTPTPP